MITVVKMSKMYDPLICYVGRPSIYGNPYSVIDHGRDGAVLKFIEYWYAPKQKYLREVALKLIPQNAKLGCWCAPGRCHGDIIAGYLNWKRSEAV